MKTLVSTLLLILLLTSCATPQQYHERNYFSRIDPITIRNQLRYNNDCNECAVLADEWQKRANQQMFVNLLGGAILGAAVGAATGSIVGGNSGWAGYGAGLGAVTGGAAGVAYTPNHRDAVFANCMINRGYRLLW